MAASQVAILILWVWTVAFIPLFLAAMLLVVLLGVAFMLFNGHREAHRDL